MSERILVTSALPFVNNVPHLGNLVCVISADVYTRFMRLMHKDVVSVLGTDEHGTTSEVKALEEGISTQELCDKYYTMHKNIYDWFECDFDCFGRTSSEENAKVTIDIFNRLNANGFILQDSLDQLYCESCKRFLADRFVLGKCPKCGYEHARGDQCENCGSLLNATELLGSRCKLCNSSPVVKESRHLFIDLPKLSLELEQWMDSVKSDWSENARTMTDAWMREGLRKRCITRDLKWGIPVPLKGFEGKVFYSWFDAPIGYIGITAECRKDWKDWWHSPSQVRLVQFMGKDNIPFHTILFPAFLIGTKDNYTLMSRISVNEFLNYEGGQFSKSRNIGVFGDDAVSTGLSPDVFRYYLMINRPERNDSDFSWDDFLKKNNSELVANLGNLVNRTMVFLNKSFDSVIPASSLNDSDRTFLDEVRSVEDNILSLADSISLKEALKEVMHLSRMGNQYLQENEPWKNPSKERRDTCLFILANLVKDISILVQPFMPLASKSIRRQLGISGNISANDLGKMSLVEGHRVNDAELLFRKIDDKEIDLFKERFSGEKNANTAPSHLKKNLKETTAALGADSSFERLQLRVAKIIDVKKHPDASKLYIEQIDLGDEQRQIVSGLVPYYTEEELLGRKIIVVANLEAAKLRGVESQGMLLAAEENGVVGLLGSDDDIGSHVYIDRSDKIHKTDTSDVAANETSDTNKINKTNKTNKTTDIQNTISIKEFAAISLKVRDGQVEFNGSKLRTRAGLLTVDRVRNGRVS